MVPRNHFAISSALMLSLVLVPHALGGEAEPGKVLRIIAFGAHPDDAEFQIGGCAAKWAQTRPQSKVRVGDQRRHRALEHGGRSSGKTPDG